MTRAFLLGLALLATACGSKKPPGESLCVAMIPPPAACNMTCAPGPGAPNSCPAGFHCTADGKCDISCTQTGGECGAGFECTADGSCVIDGVDAGVIIDAADCPAVHLTAKKVTPVVELLLDQSGSMTEHYPDPKNNNDPQRWTALQNSLVNAGNAVVKDLAPSVIFGSTLYTCENTGPCPVLQVVPRAINNFAAIKTQLNTNVPVNNTPTGESIDAVVADFSTNPPTDPSAPKIIVLATDGLPDTCTDHNPPNQTAQLAANASTEVAAQRAFTAGIKLFFLFVGDAGQAGMHPQRMANAGAGKNLDTGTEKFFEATNPAEMTAAFNTIIGGVVSCDLKLSGSVSQADAPNGIVKLNGTTLVYTTDWTLDADGLTIHLVGGACTMLKAAANPTVDAEFPCGTIIF